LYGRALLPKFTKNPPIDGWMDGPQPVLMSFQDLVHKYGISDTNKRNYNYNFLIKNIPTEWLEHPNIQNDDIFEVLVSNMIGAPKVPRYAYSIMLDRSLPQSQMVFWQNFADHPLDKSMWEEVHLRNFKCSICTKLRAFYFRFFHNAIAFNDFSYRINRKDSPNCIFCQKMPETISHIFCFCEKIQN